MNKIQVNIDSALGKAEVEGLVPQADAALSHVLNGTAAGNDFLGWVKLPAETSKELLDDIQATARQLQQDCEVVVAIGIGGSYLGAKAVIEALADTFAPTATPVLFAGQNIGEDYLFELLEHLKGKKYGIIVI